MGDAVVRIQHAVKAADPDARVLCYRRIGDSNLQVVINVPSASADRPQQEVDDIVYAIVRGIGVTVSAEHGIGLIEKPFRSYTRSPEELALMRRIKTMLDPRNVLNPGKVF